MKTQTGRSMIEMLGVLAIIGVLSVGGLVGYQRAMRSNRINSALNYISECFTAVRGRGDGMSVIQAGVGVGIQCNTIVGPAPAGVAYSTCRRAQGGETGCSLKMTNGQYEDSAISLALREKLGTTPVNQVTHFHLSSDGTWSEGVSQPSW